MINKNEELLKAEKRFQSRIRDDNRKNARETSAERCRCMETEVSKNL